VATPDFLLDWLPILVFLGIAGALSIAFLIAPMAIAPKDPDPEKVSTYECGFNAFDDARMKFDVQFYIVSILFIIVDLDVAFLFPWAVTLFNPDLGAGRDFQIFAFWSMFVFLAVFTIGFLYEWKKGALEWR
jgi:NADH-quinone oxidoreductase subunit A